MSDDTFIPGGCILLSRQIIKSEVWGWAPWQLKLWLFMLLRACHSDCPAHRLKRGQLRVGYQELRDAATYYAGVRPVRPSRPQVAKFIRRLRERNMVATAKATRGTVITILNYEVYQVLRHYEGNGESASEGRVKETLGSHEIQEGMNNDMKKKPRAPKAAGGSAQPSKPSKLNAWKLWLDAWRSARPGSPDPLAVGPDTWAAKELGKLLGDADELSRMFKAYLADADSFLHKQGHSLRLLPGRVQAYRGGQGATSIRPSRRFAMADEQPNKFEGK